MASSNLQSNEHRDLLDIIDRLRSRGFNKYVDLPGIVVCGDQSAGKSSVLEAISGMSFPTKDNLCTRFATELILRRQTQATIKVSISAGPESSSGDTDDLERFSANVDALRPDVGYVVEKAKAAMGLSDVKRFSTDILRIELGGPTQPHLTMVDLPGLFRAGNRDQSVEDAEVVRKMVRGYVERPRCIILAVVSAKSDFALQEITELARELDPKGIRTLGLITKPDTLDAGSDSEAAYLKLAQNKDVEFRLGWHVLKNRDYEMRNATTSERDEAEESFFRTGAWASVHSRQVGVESLRPRLSNVLKDQILQQLPGLLHDVASEISACSAQLQRLGTPRTTIEEQRRYLFQVSREFTTLMQAAVNGEYSNPFFGNARNGAGATRRLRARIQNALEKFAENMRVNGQKRILMDELPNEGGQEFSERQVLRLDYVEEVKQLMMKSRGRELPGTFNPLIIGELFSEQCGPWRALVDDAKRDILQAIDEVTSAIVSHVATDDTASGILSIISHTSAEFRKMLDAKIEELLQSHLSGHPITYNHYLTDNVQKAQEDRRRKTFAKALKEIIGVENFKTNRLVEVYTLDLFNKLKERTQVDMQLHASELATDYMEAYYKVACKKLVDDISVLAVECCQVGKLPSLFQAEAVLDLDDDEIVRLAQEDQDAAKQRQQCKEKLAVLEAGKDDLKRLDAHRCLSSVQRKSHFDDAVATAYASVSDSGPKSLHDNEPQSSETPGNEGTNTGGSSSSLQVAPMVDSDNAKWDWDVRAKEPEPDFMEDSWTLPSKKEKKEKQKKKVPNSSFEADY